MQVARVSIPKRRANCAENDCEWFLHGRAGMDDGHPFSHPAGVECGDFRGCLPCASPIEVQGANGRVKKKLCGKCGPCVSGTSNCPCAQRQHWTTDEALPLRHVIATSAGVRIVEGQEWKDRLAEGQYAAQRIKQEGI